MRLQLEREANELGVPFTNDTTEAELTEMIAARSRPFATTVASETQEPSCFGLWWAANTEETCKSCDVQARCLSKFALETIPEAAKKAGGSLSDAEYAAQLTVPIETIVAAFSVREHRQLPRPGSIDKPVLTQELPVKTKPKKPTPPPKAVAKKVPPKKGATKKVPRVTDSVARVAESVGEAAVSATVAVVPAREKLPPKTGQTGRSRKKVPPKLAKPSSPQKTAVTKGNISPRSPKKLQSDTPWGAHTHETRWLRERARSPLIAAIPVGSTLKRKWEGEPYEVICRKGFWMWRSVQYPTLYAVTLAITGARSYPTAPTTPSTKPAKRLMSNWSAPRFWKLEQRAEK